MDQRGALVGMVEMNAQYLPDHSSPLSQAGDVRPAMTNHVYEERSWKLKELSAALGVHLHTIIWRKGNHVVAANYPYPPRICLFISIANWKLGGGQLGGLEGDRRPEKSPHLQAGTDLAHASRNFFLDSFLMSPCATFPRAYLYHLYCFLCALLFSKRACFFLLQVVTPPKERVHRCAHFHFGTQGVRTR